MDNVEIMELIVLCLTFGIIGLYGIHYVQALYLRYQFYFYLDNYNFDVWGSTVDLMQHVSYIKFNFNFATSTCLFLLLKLIFVKFVVIGVGFVGDVSVTLSQIDHLISICSYLANYNPRTSGILS